MFRKTDYAVVTEKALRSGQIGFAYKDRATAPKDSGWRMMCDKDEDPYDLIDPDKLYACDLKRLIRHFPEIQAFVKEKNYTIAELNGATYDISIDKELKAVPNRMAGKNKYAVIMGGGMGMGKIITADPADEKSFGEQPWEKLIPQR